MMCLRKLLPILLTASWSAGTVATHSPEAVRAPAGIAWRVQGDWQEDLPPGIHGHEGDRAVRNGGLILPGALLRPSELQTAHSITIFLPDGQRILYECFTEEDCARGFRVPALTERPSALAVHMLRQMSSVLLRNEKWSSPSRSTGASSPGPARTTFAKLDEAVVTPDSKGNVTVSGLLATLPNGSYTYNLVSLDHATETRSHSTLNKSSAKCVFAVPASGLYDLTIYDAQNTARIDFFLAVIQPAETSAFSSLPRARSLLADWNALYYGWPIHEFLRAYFKALMETASKHL